MADEQSKVTPGTTSATFPASLYNALVELAAWWRGGGNRDGGGRKPGAQGWADDRPFWAAIVSSSSIGTNQWNYKLVLMSDGDASSHDGLAAQDEDEWDGRNTWERGGLTNAGYESTAIDGILPIPNNAIVRGSWTMRNGSQIITFAERNEPECD